MKQKRAGSESGSILQRIVGDTEGLRRAEEWEYSLLRRYLEQHPDLKELYESKKAPVFGPGGLRSRLGEIHMDYFAQAYFPEYIPTPPPPFHQEMFADLKMVVEKGGGSSMVRAAPRGHAKTTLWDFVFPLWVTVYKKKQYILIISDSYDQAQGFIANIKEELENNERLIEDFGQLKGEGRWQEGSIITKNKVKIEALGAGMKIRGRRNKARRPDLIILDDVENDENTETPEQRKKLKNWYKRAVRRAGAKYTDFVIVGTVIHDESLLADLLKTPGYNAKKYQAVIRFAEREDLWDQWKKIFTDLSREDPEGDARAFFEERREEMLKGTEILWDKGNPNFPDGYYSIMVARVVDGEGSFASELQNDPRSSEEKFFKPRTYSDDQLPPYHQLDVVMTVDPSMGQTDKSDFSAIIALGTERKKGQMYTLVADIQRRHPDKIIDDLFTHAQHLLRSGLKLSAVGIEEVQFQAFFKDECAKRAKQHRLHLPIVPVRNQVAKDLRIESMEPSINNGYVLIHEKHTLLLSQLENYPKAKKDGPDALEMAIRLAREKRPIDQGLVDVLKRLRIYGEFK